MSPAPPFVMINKPGEEAVRWAVQQLDKTGLRVVRTFDLREARLAYSDCPRPHHGTEACDCQMIVLLVYEGDHSPASIIVHSFQETTWFYLVDAPEQPVSHRLETMMQKSLTPPVAVLSDTEN